MSKRTNNWDEESVDEDSSAVNTPKKKKAGKSSSTEALSNTENSLLANLMGYHMRGIDGVSFEKCGTDLGFMKRTKSWNKAWAQLLEKGLIESVVPGGAKTTADHRLTESGKAQASTPEYEEFIKDKTFTPASNQDHQDRIKKRLVNDKSRGRGVQIFDLLLEHGPLTRKELCGILGVQSGTHSFSYALKELKDKGLIDGKGSEKLRLSDKAFLDPSVDRPAHVSDSETIQALLSASKYANEHKDGGGKKPKQKKIKGETNVKQEAVKTEPESVSSSAKQGRSKKDANETNNSGDHGDTPNVLVKKEMPEQIGSVAAV